MNSQTLMNIANVGTVEGDSALGTKSKKPAPRSGHPCRSSLPCMMTLTRAKKAKTVVTLSRLRIRLMAGLLVLQYQSKPKFKNINNQDDSVKICHVHYVAR